MVDQNNPDSKESQFISTTAFHAFLRSGFDSQGRRFSFTKWRESSPEQIRNLKGEVVLLTDAFQTYAVVLQPHLQHGQEYFYLAEVWVAENVNYTQFQQDITTVLDRTPYLPEKPRGLVTTISSRDLEKPLALLTAGTT